MSDELVEITVAFDPLEWAVLSAAAHHGRVSATELVAKWCTEAVEAAAADPSIARAANALAKA